MCLLSGRADGRQKGHTQLWSTGNSEALLPLREGGGHTPGGREGGGREEGGREGGREGGWEGGREGGGEGGGEGGEIKHTPPTLAPEGGDLTRRRVKM